MKQQIMKYLDNSIVGVFATLLKLLYPFLFPIQGFLVFVFCVVICDTITGIFAAQKRGEKVMSSGLRRTIVKILIYFIAVLLGQGMRVVFLPQIDVAYAIAFIIAVTEFKSNLENIAEITGTDIWSFIKDKFTIAKK